MSDSEWKPGRWWRVTLSDGTLWMETSDPDEAQFGLIGEDGKRKGHPDGARIQRIWERSEAEWRDHNPT